MTAGRLSLEVVWAQRVRGRKVDPQAGEIIYLVYPGIIWVFKEEPENVTGERDILSLQPPQPGSG